MSILPLMETFAAVVDTGSFTAAAEQLGLSKSFVSKQISQLENHTGTRLLHRSTRKLSLTDEGKQFYKHCKLVVDEAIKAQEEIIDSQTNPRGRIRFAIPQSIAISNLSSVIKRFQEKYPNILLEIIASGTTEKLIDEGFDLALRIGQLEDSTLVCRRLSECHYQTVASPRYLKEFGRPSHPKELTEHNCLIYASASRQWSYQTNGESFKVSARGNLVSNDGNMIVGAVLNGQGIAYGPSILYQPHVAQGKLKHLFEDYAIPPVSISIVYPSKQNISHKVSALISFLSEHLFVESETNSRLSTYD